MLKVDQLNSHEYLRYVSLGPSSVSNKSESLVSPAGSGPPIESLEKERKKIKGDVAGTVANVGSQE